MPARARDARTATLGTGAITSSTFAAGAINAAAIATDAGTEIADAILARSVATVEGTMPEHCLGTIVLAALEWTISGSDWVIKRTDGSTTHATKPLTTSGSADLVTSVT